MDIFNKVEHIREQLGSDYFLKTAQTNTLFPKLTGANKPPVLTPKNQKAIDINEIDPPELPDIKIEGLKPRGPKRAKFK
jgi:hypothetical protein